MCENWSDKTARYACFCKYRKGFYIVYPNKKNRIHARHLLRPQVFIYSLLGLFTVKHFCCKLYFAVACIYVKCFFFMTTKKIHNLYALHIFHYKNKLLQWLKMSLSLELLFQLRQTISLKVNIDLELLS